MMDLVLQVIFLVKSVFLILDQHRPQFLSQSISWYLQSCQKERAPSVNTKDLHM